MDNFDCGACLASLPIMGGGCLGFFVAPVLIVMTGYFSYERYAMYITPQVKIYHVKSIDTSDNPVSFTVVETGRGYGASPRLTGRMVALGRGKDRENLPGIPVQMIVPPENQSDTIAFAADQLEFTPEGRRSASIGLAGLGLAALAVGLLGFLGLSEMGSVDRSPPRQGKRGRAAHSKRPRPSDGTLKP